MAVIERDGARIHYEVTGDGPPVLLGHSLLCDGQMWAGVAPELARTHRVVNVDARGHGQSTAPGPFTLDDLAADWLAIMDAEGLPRAALCGLSMGGMTAMRLALRAPDRVAGLALLDTSAAPEALGKRAQYLLMAETVKRLGPLEPILGIATRALLGKTTRTQRPALVAQETARMRGLDRLGLYHSARAVFNRRSIVREIAGIRAPTLVLVGTEDTATSPERSEQIAGAIPDSLLIMLPRVGHLSALEAPEIVAREVLAHLARCRF